MLHVVISQPFGCFPAELGERVRRQRPGNLEPLEAVATHRTEEIELLASGNALGNHP
jgi:hypothetical protein